MADILNQFWGPYIAQLNIGTQNNYVLFPNTIPNPNPNPNPNPRPNPNSNSSTQNRHTTTNANTKTTKKTTSPIPYTICYVNPNTQSATQRLQLLMVALVRLKWINDPQNADDFMALFEGKSRECNIKWTDNINQATIYYFLRKLLEQPYIQKPNGCSARSLMQFQFHISNPRADDKRVSNKSKKAIDILLKLINPQVPLPSHQEDIISEIFNSNLEIFNGLDEGMRIGKSTYH